MHCEGKFELRSHNRSYCLIEVVTNAGQKETEDTYEVIRTSTIAKYQSINQSTIGSETNRTYDSNNIETKDVSNNSYKEEIDSVSLVLSCYFEVYPLNQKSHMVR
jgi:hypothetical protein